MTKHQKSILEEIKNGANLQCTEGSNYRTWLIYPDGSTKTVRRDTAEKICFIHMSDLDFGNVISWRKRK